MSSSFSISVSHTCLSTLLRWWKEKALQDFLFVVPTSINILFSLTFQDFFTTLPSFFSFIQMRRLSPKTTTVIWFMCPTHCSPTPPFCVLAAFNAIFDMLAPWLQCTRTSEEKKSARNSIADLISIANHEHTCALSNATLTLESGKSWLFEHVCQAACLAVWRMCI